MDFLSMTETLGSVIMAPDAMFSRGHFFDDAMCLWARRCCESGPLGFPLAVRKFRLETPWQCHRCWLAFLMLASALEIPCC